MNDSRNRLERLIDLASETQSERRRELLHEITEVFLTAPKSYNAQESRYFGEIMGKVAYDLEQAVRVELANKLASEEAAPADLIRQLANDEISVAQPLLEHSPVLDEGDLIRIAASKSQDHLLAITHRQDIGEKLSDVLVDKGDDRVVHGLVQNRTARIGQQTMGKVVARAEVNPILHKPLIDRPDLPAELMKEMLSFVSAELKNRILEHSSHVNSDKLKRILEDVESSVEAKANMNKNVRSKPEFLIDQLERAGELDQYKLVELAKLRKVPEFICGLARIAELDMATARRVILDRSGEGLAIVSKACKFEQATYSAIINNIWPDSDRSIEHSCRMIALYDQVTPETAQRVMRFWKVRRQSTDETRTEQPAPAASAG
jgi:uncharacterized protein (DUF2336 family)